jgi:hypothetical protein
MLNMALNVSEEISASVFKVENVGNSSSETSETNYFIKGINLKKLY